MKSIVLNFFLLFTCFFYVSSFGQISLSLDQSLPDSLRPENPESLTLSEFQKILLASFNIKGWGPKEFRELDSLCYQLGPKYTTITDTEERLKFLRTICSVLHNSHNLFSGGTPVTMGRNSLYQISQSNIDFCIKYVNIYIDEIEEHASTDKLALLDAYFIKAFFYVENNNFLESEKNFQIALNLAKTIKSIQYITKCYNQLAWFYNLLGLATQSITYSDSATSAIGSVSSNSEFIINGKVATIFNKQQAYLKLFVQNQNISYADSLLALHKQLIYDSYTKGRRKASSFIMLAGLSFYKHNYEQSLIYLDSAKRTFPELHLLVLWQEGMVYKGVSLLRLGREKEAKKVFNLLNFENVQTPVVTIALKELIALENLKHNLTGVIYYQNQLLTFNQKRHAIEMQGKALEMAQKYNLEARDAQILQLQKLKKLDRWITFFVVLTIILILLLILIRYLNTKAKSDRLIQQIDELTEMQIVQIEEAQLLERKRIGQELHDELASSIAMATRFLLLKADQSSVPSDKMQTIRIANALQESYDMTRMQSHRLFQEDSTQEFCKRLSTKIELLFAGTTIQFVFSAEINGLVLSVDIKTTLLMVIKEALTNIIKHANATRVEIVLYYNEGLLILEISDNGKGISGYERNRGIGLKTAQNRIASLNGNMTIKSIVPSGTILEIYIPVYIEESNLLKSV